MLHDIYSLEILAGERQKELLAQSRELRDAGVSNAPPPVSRSSPFAPLLAGVGQLLISAGESLRRAAYP